MTNSDFENAESGGTTAVLTESRSSNAGRNSFETYGQAMMRQAAKEDVWGIAASIDIYDCNPDAIRDAEGIKRFVRELCDLIEMKRFGETLVVHFGEDERVAGYSMVQLIETSLISAHFANESNATYLDVFSCKPYDPEIVQTFAENYFGGKRSSLSVTMRR